MSKLIHCQEPWFSLIREGVKPVEGRKNSPRFSALKPGERLTFTNGADSFDTVILRIAHFPTLRAYLEGVGLQNALPGVASLEEAEKIYLQWSTREEIEKYGFLGIYVQVTPLLE